MKPKHVKKLLFSAIEATSENYTDYVNNAKTDFTRNRKLSFSKIIKAIIGMESKSITNELIDFFQDSESLPSASAFVQQRQKIKIDAFKSIFEGFTSKLISKNDKDLVLLAVDGSDIQIPINPDDSRHYKLIPHSTPFDYLPLKLKKHEDAQFFELNFRIVRFKVTENLYETVLTNLDKNNYIPEKHKELYNSRWGIETSFRDLKYTIGMLDFHSKKVMCIHLEIYAHLIMYNFAEMITSHVVIEKSKENIHIKPTFRLPLICADNSSEGKQHHLI